MDQQHPTNEDMRLIYSVLPERIKEVIFAPETTDVYESVTKKFNLNDTQRRSVVTETEFLLMGLRDPKDLIENLARRLAVAHEIAVGIARELNQHVFAEIKEELRALYTSNEGEEVKVLEQKTETSGTLNNETTPPAAPKMSSNGFQDVGPKPHIGNIFEEKLGGSFRMKSDEVSYTASKAKAEITPIPRVTPPTPPPSTIPTPTTASPVSPATPTPTPASTTPPLPPTPPAPPIPTAKGPDPYREAV